MTPATIAALRIVALVAAYRERYGADAAALLVAGLAKECASGVAQFVGHPTCAIEGCQKRAYGLNLYCPMHRLRFQRTGDPLLVRRPGRKKR